MSDPITPLRLSEINVDRLNRMLVQLNQQMQGLSERIAKLEGKPAVTAGKNDYPGVEAGSKAIIGGPPQGGPLPLQPWIDDHSLVIGEGSKPMHWIKGTDGQVPIACTGNDPAFANLQGDGIEPLAGPAGVAITNGCNTIAISLNISVWTWINDTQAWMAGMKIWTDTVSTILSISKPVPDPPLFGPT